MRKKAISLIEILIGTVILLAAIIPLWGLMGSSNQQVMRSADEIKASQLTVEILEQIEHYIKAEDLPDESDGYKEFNLVSGGYITLNEGQDKVKIKVGTFEDYLKPKLLIGSSPRYNNSSEEVGRIVTLVMEYERKDGQGSENPEYTLRGFVSAN